MARLSQSIRESMAKALVRHRFDERAKVLCAESVSLFHFVMDDLHNADTRKLMAQLEKRHKGAFQRDDDLTVNVAGRRISIGSQLIGGVRGVYGSGWKAQADPRSFLQCDRGYDKVSYLDGPIAERLTAFADGVEALRAEAEAAYRKALGALAQFGTGKRLAAEWPEAMPVIGNLIPENDRQLPVVQVAALNIEFELPPELAEAA